MEVIVPLYPSQGLRLSDVVSVTATRGHFKRWSVLNPLNLIVKEDSVCGLWHATSTWTNKCDNKASSTHENIFQYHIM